MCIRDRLYADDIIYIETELHKNVFYTEKGTFQIYKKPVSYTHLDVYKRQGREVTV